jgi:hypothetical protein
VECIDWVAGVRERKDYQISGVHGRAPSRKFYIYSMNEEESDLYWISKSKTSPKTDERHR